MGQPVNYLLILKDRVKSGFSNDKMLRVITQNGSEELTRQQLFDCNSAIQLHDMKCLLFYDESPIDDSGENGVEKEKRYKQSRGKLKKILGGDSVHIFYHKGGDFIKLKEVVDDFNDKYWEAEDVFPYSANMCQQWEGKIGESLAALMAFLSEDNGDSESNLDGVLELLDQAWNIAFCFYKIDQPLRGVLESLFPLYIDIRNQAFTEKLNQCEFEAVFVAAKDNLSGALSAIGLTGGENDLKKILGDIKESIDEDNKSLAKAGIMLLEKLERLERLTQKDTDDFIIAFDSLSGVYTSRFDMSPSPVR